MCNVQRAWPASLWTDCLVLQCSAQPAGGRRLHNSHHLLGKAWVQPLLPESPIPDSLLTNQSQRNPGLPGWLDSYTEEAAREPQLIPDILMYIDTFVYTGWNWGRRGWKLRQENGHPD